MAKLAFIAFRVVALRGLILSFLYKWEGGMMFSLTIRRIFKFYYGVSVGSYSYGPGLKRGVFSRGTEIGNYCSIAEGLLVFRRNHSLNRFSQHPLFYNSSLGLVKADTISLDSDNPLRIGHDVWIGANVIICPGCNEIGNGAVIGAGSVVTKPVPPFTIVGGNPAKFIRQRYSPEVEEVIARSEWWLHPYENIVANLDLFTKDIDPERLQLFCQQFVQSSKQPK